MPHTTAHLLDNMNYRKSLTKLSREVQFLAQNSPEATWRQVSAGAIEVGYSALRDPVAEGWAAERGR